MTDTVTTVTTKHVADLEPGDSYPYQGTTVTVKTAPRPSVDRFGQPMLRFFAHRADTGVEGWVTFGRHAELSGVVSVGG